MFTFNPRMSVRWVSLTDRVSSRGVAENRREDGVQKFNGDLIFSPSDLVLFFQSPFASWMARAALEDPAWNERRDPPDAMMESLAKKGGEHEISFNQSLSDAGTPIVEIDRGEPNAMWVATTMAMKRGAPAIAQGYLRKGRFAGIADLLIRVPVASGLGSWSYEIWDTKLSRSMKPQYAIQLCAYAEMLEDLQGALPGEVSIVLGTTERVGLRTASYMPFYRTLKSSFLLAQDNFDKHAMPDPGASASCGEWSELAKGILEETDHLRLVANITKGQIKNLGKVGIQTVADLATSGINHVPKISDPVFSRLKRQAALQIASRGRHEPVWELTDHSGEVPAGLRLLPPASGNDVFFDIEGFPLVEGGLEYLWGATYYESDGTRSFADWWAHDSGQEKEAFAGFVRWAFDRWTEDRRMHIYHYASYEVSALRRLMGRYGVCEHEVDQLLRNNVFVDLYQIVRQGLIVGEPRYSIKNIEHLYRPPRDTEVASGGDSVVVYEHWRENPDGDDWNESAVLKSIRDYNKDDCDSTEELTRWLRDIQRENGLAFDLRHVYKEAPNPEERIVVASFRDDLLDVAARHAANGDRQLAGAIETIAYSLEFHQREAKPTWWRYFDRLASTDVELYEDKDCLAGLVRTSAPADTTTYRGLAFEYSFDPDQDFKAGATEYRVLGLEDVKVSIESLDERTGLAILSSEQGLPRRLSLLPMEYVNPKPIPKAIEKAAQRAFEAEFGSSAIMHFLTRARPRIRGNEEGPIISGDGRLLDEIVGAVADLDESCLCIQGPPGAGKTYTASRAIRDLLCSGRRVGITSNSHKAINNLIKGVLDASDKVRSSVRPVKVDRDEKRDPELYDRSDVNVVKDAAGAEKRLLSGANLVGGTPWAFANEKLHGGFDYLFVDEAGQVSVANLIGMSLSARNIVLMGDQMQLSQPTQGMHPGASGQSLLEYYMEDRATIPPDQGIFLPTTFRMHPDVCGFISEAIYEGRLVSEDATKGRHIRHADSSRALKSAGIEFVPVQHEGNTQASEEEVLKIQSIVRELLQGELIEDGEARQLTLADILFITPYNHQRRKLEAAFGPDARVGTVDKFQGQEAPIVILSMCSSDVNESPRGLDFLFSKNRINVAISRAICLAIIVGSPNLADTSVSNLRQMELASLFCRVVENGS
jgi:uncharacterized protein